MAEQLALAGTQSSLKDLSKKPLTDRQQLAYDYVRTTPGGVTADEVGAFLHAHKPKRPHSVDERCDWCARDGRSVLTSVALKPLVTRTRAGKWLPRDKADRARDPSAQTGVIPF